MLTRSRQSFVSLRVSRDRSREQEKAIHLELAVNGSLADRKLVALGEQHRDSGGSALLSPGDAPRCVMARWGITAGELGLPLDLEHLAKLDDSLAPALAAARRGLGILLPAATSALGSATAMLSAGMASMSWRLLRDLEGSFAQRLLNGFALTLPQRIADPLCALCEKLLDEDEVLWLEILHPSSYLPLVPWEQLVRKCVPNPLVRRSPHAVYPITPARPLRTIVCASGASRRRLLPAQALADGVTQIRDALPAGSVVHVFADRAHHAALEPLITAPTGANGSVLRIHDLNGTESATPEAGGTGHPWARWITASLAGEAVDLVHWISPAELGADRGRMAVLADPSAEPAITKRRLGVQVSTPHFTPGGTVRYVTAEEMHAFMNRLGAWGAVISSPGDPASRAGLRMLADDLAQLRPGPFALHEFGGAKDDALLSRLYEFIVAPANSNVPPPSTLALYSHPGALAQHLEHAGAELGILPQEIVEPQRSTEQWVASGRRIVEQNITECLSHDGSSELTLASRRGRARGIALVANLLAEAESTTGGGEP